MHLALRLLFCYMQPVPVADIEQLSMVQVEKEDHLLSSVTLFLPSTPIKVHIMFFKEQEYFRSRNSVGNSRYSWYNT